MVSKKYRKFYENENDHQISMYSNRPDNYAHNRIRQIVESEIRMLMPKTVLDAGCAEGMYSKYFAKNGIFPVGCDIAFSKLRRAKIDSTATTPYLCADLQKLPFPDNSFEAVLALEIIEHVPDYRQAIKEIFRVSSKYVIISVPVGVFEGAGHINFFHPPDFERWESEHKVIHSYGILTTFMPFRRTVTFLSFKLHRYIALLDSIFCSLPYFKYTGTHIVFVFEK